MLEIPESFHIRSWKNCCPIELNKLGALLESLEQHTKKLTTLLGHAIECIIECEELLSNPIKLTPDNENFTRERRKDLYQLIALITDSPHFIVEQQETRVSAEQKYAQILIIKAQRRIDDGFLPNHQPNQAPEYIPPILPSEDPSITRNSSYYHFLLRTTQHASDRLEKTEHQEESEKLDKVDLFQKMEARLRKAHQLKRLNELSLHKKRGELLRMNPFTSVYFKEEVMVKVAQEVMSTNNLPQIEDVIQFYKDLIDAVNKIKIENKTLKDHVLDKEIIGLVQKLNKELAEIQEQESNKKDESFLYLISYTCKTLRQEIARIQTTYHIDLTFINTTMSEALAKISKIHPNLLANYYKLKRENPFLFSDNHLLKTVYLKSEEREQYRLHLYQGKIHKLQYQNGRLNQVVFNSPHAISHRKKGWVTCIMNTRGEIFASSHVKEGERYFCHSSFMNGAPVLFAGEMKIINGNIIAVSNYSGHYYTGQITPGFINLQAFARHLKNRGVNLAKCNFHEFNPTIVTEKVQQVEQSTSLTNEKKETVINKLWKDSERLKFGTCYRFKENSLVPAPNYKKIALLVGLGLLFTLSLALLIGVVICSQGIAVPFLAPLIFKIAAITSPVVSLGVGIAVPGLMTTTVATIGMKVTGFFRSIGQFFKIRSHQQTSSELLTQLERSTKASTSSSTEELSHLSKKSQKRSPMPTKMPVNIAKKEIPFFKPQASLPCRQFLTQNEENYQARSSVPLLVK